MRKKVEHTEQRAEIHQRQYRRRHPTLTQVLMPGDRLSNGLRLVDGRAKRRQQVERVHGAPKLEGEARGGLVRGRGADVVQHAGEKEGLDEGRFGLETARDVVVEEGKAWGIVSARVQAPAAASR